MPDSRPLNALRARVQVALNINRGQRDPVWGEPRLMTAALEGVKQEFDGDDDRGRPERDALVTAVRNFYRSRKVSSFTELKYVCYGVTVPIDGDGVRLIDRSLPFGRLLELVDERTAQPKQFRRCYQGLLSGYFGFAHDSKDPAAAGANWLNLRGFLGGRLAPVVEAAHARGRQPGWLKMLAAHRNLLDDKPCVRYAEGLRRGDRSELAGVCAGLGIESGSWVWHEAVMAYIYDVTRSDDPSFQHEMPKLLGLIDGEPAELRLPDTVARDAAATVVSRYERCHKKPENSQLRDVCLRRIGNPWLEREAWDANVKSEPARQMIESWLKRRLIKDFFELLAHDGAADVRRLDYWLKWEPQISDMWFVLGSDAQHKRSKPFVDLRGRMAGRLRQLTGTSDGANNAFIMRMGHLLIVEYGMTGNACYVFDASDFPASLEEPSLNIHMLKQKHLASRLLHAGPWEGRFDDELKILLRAPAPKSTAAPLTTSGPAAADRRPPLSNLIGDQSAPYAAAKAIWPKFTPPDDSRPEPSRPTRGAAVSRATDFHIRVLQGYCDMDGVQLEDNRAKGGALWIRSGNKPLGEKLMSWINTYGFRWAAGKGYYLEAKD